MAENREKWHYRLKNDSFCLRMWTNDSLWTFNNTVIFRFKEVARSFTDKVDYNPGNLSLCINKLTDADSGTYRIIWFLHGGTTVTEDNKLSVQGKSFH